MRFEIIKQSNEWLFIDAKGSAIINLSICFYCERLNPKLVFYWTALDETWDKVFETEAPK